MKAPWERDFGNDSYQRHDDGRGMIMAAETTVTRDVLFIGGRASRSSGNGSVTEQSPEFGVRASINEY